MHKSTPVLEGTVVSRTRSQQVGGEGGEGGQGQQEGRKSAGDMQNNSPIQAALATAGIPI